MKGLSPVTAGFLLLVCAAGLLGFTGKEPAAQRAGAISAWMLRQQLGPAILEEPPSPASQPDDAAPAPSAAPRPVPVETVSEAWDERQREKEPEPSQTAPPLSAGTVSLELRNETDYAPDLTALPDLPAGLDFRGADPAILIVHTHTTESYYHPEEDPSEAVYRSRDEADGVMAVGDAMAAALEARGYSVLHDKTLCDYPEYNGAYSRSREVIRKDLEEYPSICLVLDVHRDAVSDGSGGQLRMAAELDGQAVAQIMLVVGSDDGGLEHPDWEQNLSLAAALQGILAQESPGMARPLNLRSERFNQDLGPLGLLIEVGSSGNTLEEALRAADRLSQGLADLLDRYSGDNP